MKFTRRHDLDPHTRIEIVRHVWIHQGIYGQMTQIAQDYHISRTFLYHSILKFFQVDITGVARMTSYARYFKEGVGSSRPNWRWIMCFLERPKANTSCNA